MVEGKNGKEGGHRGLSALHRSHDQETSVNVTALDHGPGIPGTSI